MAETTVESHCLWPFVWKTMVSYKIALWGGLMAGSRWVSYIESNFAPNSHQINTSRQSSKQNKKYKVTANSHSETYPRCNFIGGTKKTTLWKNETKKERPLLSKTHSHYLVQRLPRLWRVNIFFFLFRVSNSRAYEIRPSRHFALNAWEIVGWAGVWTRLCEFCLP